jgi:uncharacterized damage-inducible protein DinB
MRAAFREAHERFLRRLRGAPPAVVTRTPPRGGWSLAQIAWHVAAVDERFAGLLSGERPGQPLPAGFAERSWTDIVASLPSRLEASGSLVPPGEVDMNAALDALETVGRKMDVALESLTPDRGGRFGVTHPALGTMTVYQVGDWATAHTIRHNAQAKRVLAELSSGEGP